MLFKLTHIINTSISQQRVFGTTQVLAGSRNKLVGAQGAVRGKQVEEAIKEPIKEQVDLFREVLKAVRVPWP